MANVGDADDLENLATELNGSMSDLRDAIIGLGAQVDEHADLLREIFSKADVAKKPATKAVKKRKSKRTK